jgi:hypothetical protein
MPLHRGTVASGFLGMVPDAPTSLSASLYANAQSVLTWTAPTNNGGSSITDYIVQRSTDNANWTTFTDGVSATTGATVTGLNAGTLYYFRVAAITSYGTGAYATTSATTGAAPDIPTGVSGGSGSNGSVLVSWNAVTVLPAVSSYTVAYSTSSTFATTLGTVPAYTNSLTINGLSNGTTYYFRVLATNNIASSSYSSISSGATPYTIPTANTPSNYGVAHNAASFTSSYSTGGSAITGYDWRISTDQSNWTTSSPNTAYNNFSGLSAGTTYYVQTRATNAAGTTAWTASGSCLTWSLRSSSQAYKDDIGTWNFTVPAYTPYGGSTVAPTLYEIFVASGGGGASRGGGGAGGYYSSAATAFNNANNLTLEVYVAPGGAAGAAGGVSVLQSTGNSGSFTRRAPAGGGAGSSSNVGSGGANGNGTFNGGTGGYGLGYDAKNGAFEDTSKYAAGGGAGWDGAGGNYTNSTGDPYSDVVGGAGGAGGGPAYGIAGGAGGGGAGTGGNGATGSYSQGYGNGGQAPDGAGVRGAITFKYYGP